MNPFTNTSSNLKRHSLGWWALASLGLFAPLAVSADTFTIQGDLDVEQTLTVQGPILIQDYADGVDLSTAAAAGAIRYDATAEDFMAAVSEEAGVVIWKSLTVSQDSRVSDSQIQEWKDAFAWENHAEAGYLKSEDLDPADLLHSDALTLSGTILTLKGADDSTLDTVDLSDIVSSGTTLSTPETIPTEVVAVEASGTVVVGTGSETTETTVAMQVKGDVKIEGDLEIAGLTRRGDVFMGQFGRSGDDYEVPPIQ